MKPGPNAPPPGYEEAGTLRQQARSAGGSFFAIVPFISVC